MAESRGSMRLYDYQMDAVRRMKNGCILCGGVGSGKSRTALGYYYTQNGGRYWDDDIGFDEMVHPRDLYIITTARKRDSHDWDLEMAPFLISPNPEQNFYKNTVIVDSWNNIKKYSNVFGAFFIFDEQRVVGKGAWVKSFLKIAKKNQWILLSATPGDTWMDYVPIFIANGFYRNRSDFNEQHVEFSRFTKYPKIEKYHNQGLLVKHRNDILVTMDFERKTESHHIDVYAPYDALRYKYLYKYRCEPDTGVPIDTAGELCYKLRKVVNEDERRIDEVFDIAVEKKKVIIFYNFDYELEALKHYFAESTIMYPFEVAEWNGHRHEPVPESDWWVYLVQYTAGCEAWNCITTDTIIFYSQNYSYKVMEQASGRINRLNTPFHDLYYYHIKSKAGIDIAIERALAQKKNFNEGDFCNGNSR